MELTAERALIFRITHIENAAWDLQNGLHCRSSPKVNPNFRNIGNIDLIERRKTRGVPVAPGGTLSDYVPFYFTSRSPMLNNIRTGYNSIPKVPMSEIVIYAASLREIAAAGRSIVFTDRHAKLETAQFSNDLADLTRIDWAILSASDFRRDPEDPEKMERYQAEALVHRDLDCGSMKAIVCYNDAARERVSRLAAHAGVNVPVLVKQGMFFS